LVRKLPARRQAAKYRWIRRRDPNTLNGVNYGIVRLRTASMRMDWGNTSVVRDRMGYFLSELSNFVRILSHPAFGYSGNLWAGFRRSGWSIALIFLISKTLRSRGHPRQSLRRAPYTAYSREPRPERARSPAYAARVAWTRSIHGQPLTLGTPAITRARIGVLNITRMAGREWQIGDPLARE